MKSKTIAFKGRKKRRKGGGPEEGRKERGRGRGGKERRRERGGQKERKKTENKRRGRTGRRERSVRERGREGDNEQAEESMIKGINRELAPGVWKSVECSHNMAVEDAVATYRQKAP